MAKVNFFYEDIAFTLRHPRKTSRWIQSVIASKKATLKEINYIFCSDKYLLKINQDYLNHNTFTDIVTFDNSEEDGVIESDIYISVDRVIENALRFGARQDEELRRVMVHGVLHLLGYSDKGKDKEVMRKQEDHFLKSF